MCRASSGFFLSGLALDADSAVATSTVSAAAAVGSVGIIPALVLRTSLFSGIQAIEPSGRSGLGRGGPSPTNILVIGS